MDKKNIFVNRLFSLFMMNIKEINNYLNQDKIQDRFRTTLLHVIFWILMFVLPPNLIPGLEKVYKELPVYYLTAIVYLIPFYYLSRYLILHKRIILYALFVIGGYFFYLDFYHLFHKLAGDIYFSAIPVRSAVRFYLRMKGPLSILYLIAMVFNVLEAIYRSKKQAEQEKAARIEAEMNMLKNQIDPHFLFNTLNTIYYEALEKTDVAPKAIMELSNLMRYMLKDAKDKYVPLDGEIQYIQDYIKLEKLRLPEHTEFVWEYANDRQSIYQIAPLLLIPFIENAIKYGVSPREKSDILISIRIECGKLHLKVENKIYRKNAVVSTGTGLLNVKKRLELMYPDKYKLDIQNDEVRFKVNLLLELN